MANVREVVINNGDLVSHLLSHKFAGLSYDDKVFIKKLQIPRPPMVNLVQTKAGHNRAFSKTLYDKYVWLTGSETNNKLFCWYCILFTEIKSPFNSTGYDNLKEIHRALAKHAISKEHTHSALKFKLFGKQNIVNALDSARQEFINKHNESVRENRKMIKHLINMIIFLSTQELAFRGNDETVESDNQGNFKELAKFGATLDESFNKFIDPSQSSVFTGLSKTIQNELIDSVKKVVMEKIHTEINDASCFSWEIDETTDISCFSQMSVIFRFILNGKVMERFLGFFNVSEGKTASDIFNVLTQNFGHFNIETKLIGQTYDGAAVMAGELNGLQRKIKSIAPQALFTHCYAHKLNLVLQNSSKKIKECRIFFSNLSGFSAFFTKSTKRTNLLDRICKKRLPSNSETRWNFKSRAVNILSDSRTNLIEVFDHIIEHLDQWDDISIRESTGLKNLLTDFEFVFLLLTFNLIFTYTDPVFAIIQNRLSDITYCNERITSLLNTLKQFRTDESYFTNIYSKARDIPDIIPPSTKRRKVSDLSDNSLTMKRLFLEIFDLIINQIEIRFKDISSLNFLELTNMSKFDAFNHNFPDAQFNSLIHNYQVFFNNEKLKRELQILYSDKTIFGNSQKISDMTEFIYKNELITDVPELYKLFCLILSLPPTSASVERSFSTLKRIKSLTRNTVSQSRLNNLSTLAIERGLIKELMKDDSFYDKIIDDFALSKPRRIDLLFKKV